MLLGRAVSESAHAPTCTRLATGCVPPLPAVLLLSVFLAGCTLPPPPPPPVAWSVSEETRASIDDILLAPSTVKVRPVVTLPAKGAGEGAGRGAAIGAATPVAIGAQGDPYTLIGGILLAPFTAVLGTGIGAVSALPAEEVETAERLVETAFSEIDFHEGLASALRERVETDAGRPVAATISGPSGTVDIPDYSTAAGGHAVIEVRVTKVGLDGPWSINPPIRFVLDARVRLIRLPNGQLLWDRRLSYEGPKLTLTEWSHDKASQIRKHFALGTAALAERIVDELFLLHIPDGMDGRPA